MRDIHGWIYWYTASYAHIIILAFKFHIAMIYIEKPRKNIASKEAQTDGKWDMPIEEISGK